MSLVATNLTNLLGRYLDLAADRQAVVANNIANMDTPGYKARDTNFGEQLKNLLGGQDGQTSQRIAEVPGLIERPDGNNVSLDREGLLLGQTQLQFQTAIELVRAQFKQVSTAIKEGGSQ